MESEGRVRYFNVTKAPTDEEYLAANNDEETEMISPEMALRRDAMGQVRRSGELYNNPTKAETEQDTSLLNLSIFDLIKITQGVIKAREGAK